MDKVQMHKDIVNNLNAIYKAKNNDYGDSFAIVRQRHSNAIMIRLWDKLLRLETLLNGEQQLVKDESIDDTLIDLANYAIMELVERKRSSLAEEEKDLMIEYKRELLKKEAADEKLSE